MKIGQLLRVIDAGVARQVLDAGEDLPTHVDGLDNFYSETLTHSGNRPTLTTLAAGINPLGRGSSSGVVPAICIRSSPHRAGTAATPWQDHFDIDVGHVSYSGDNKPGKGPPEATRGNKALLAQLELHQSPDRASRLAAAPLVFFVARTGVALPGAAVEFSGIGFIEKAERVVQWDAKAKTTFVNYLFDAVVIDLSAENEEFDWNWIRQRRKDHGDLEAALALAPAAWRRWVNEGQSAIERVRRRVSRIQIVPTGEQRPAPGSREDTILSTVYSHYKGKEARFEGVAELVVERIIKDAGAEYRRGWITPGGGDYGIDFIGRVDLGTGFARTKLVMLGQAKCQALNSPTSGRDVARIVARLRRGWVGAYVTTSYFSTNTQTEIIEDRYPVMMVHGLQLAEVLDRLMFERGLANPTDVTLLLADVDAEYEQRLSARDAEQVLLIE